MNYAETLDYLYTRLPMFSRTGAAALKPGLGNTIRLCSALGNPQQLYKSIHVAGTNGKGSTSHMLAAVFQKSGYKTGLYTSPHLIDFRERIRLDGTIISQQYVVDFVARNLEVIEEVSPSFFEITVAMAFAAFAEEKVDIAIIETGLGGRLDSTNVIIPELSIITNISLDHTDLLGDTRTKIAVEKSGIIKENIPVIIGSKHDETISVFKAAAAQKKASIIFAEEAYKAIPAGFSATHHNFEVTNHKRGTSENYPLDLSGNYQSENLQTVLASLDNLSDQGWNLPRIAIKNALRDVRLTTGLAGRYQKLGEAPLIIADVGHNVAGLEAVLAQWKNEKVSDRHIITGFVRDKDIEAALALFPKNGIYYFTNAAIPRALPAADLSAMAMKFGLNGKAYDTVDEATNAALAEAKNYDGILITGSFFIVGEAMSFLKTKMPG